MVGSQQHQPADCNVLLASCLATAHSHPLAACWNEVFLRPASSAEIPFNAAAAIRPDNCAPAAAEGAQASVLSTASSELATFTVVHIAHIVPL